MSTHQPQPAIIVCGGRNGPGVRGTMCLPARARRGGAKQTKFMPVLMASGGHITRTTRVHRFQQPARIVRKISHYRFLSATASHEQQRLMRKFGNVRKAFGEIRNV